MCPSRCCIRPGRPQCEKSFHHEFDVAYGCFLKTVIEISWKYKQIQFKAILLMTTNEWKWVVKHFHLLQSLQKADRLFGKVFSANRIHCVVRRKHGWRSRADWHTCRWQSRNEWVQRQTAHLIAQISVEVMCKLLFRWMGRVQSFIHKICTERYMNTQTPLFNCTVWYTWVFYCNRAGIRLILKY